MKFKAHYFLATLLVLLLQTGMRAESIPEGMGRNIPNFHSVDKSFYRGGQPSPAGIRQLAQMGIKTIIDLRQKGKRAQAEEQLATKLGLHYYNIPLSNWKGPSSDQITKFLELVGNPSNGPVFVHCRRGADRTGLMSGIYRMVKDKWPVDQAYEEMRGMGARSLYVWYKRSLYDYARQRPQDEQKVESALEEHHPTSSAPASEPTKN